MKLDTFVLRLDGNQKFSLHKIANRGCFVSRLSLFIKYFFCFRGNRFILHFRTCFSLTSINLDKKMASAAKNLATKTLRE